MKRLIILIASLGSLLGFLLVFLSGLLVLPVHADDHPFYSFGRWYDPPQVISGEIISVSGTGEGRAGIEQNTIIETDKGQLDIEITSWYKGTEYYRNCSYPYDCSWLERPYYDIGLIVWLEGQTILAKRERAKAEEFYAYIIKSYPDRVNITISKEQETIIDETIGGFQSLRVKNIAGYLEYYDYGTPFYYYGYVTLNGLNYGREDTMRDFKNFKAYTLQRNWDDKIYFKGEIQSKS